MAFNCDLVFSYSNRREYIGLHNFRNTISMQVQRVYDAGAGSGLTPTGMPPMWTGAYTGIIVNGVNFGTGRIISFSNPVSADISENGRHLWKQNVSIEVYESGDLSNISAVDSSVSALLDAYSTNLVGLEENFNFETSQNGNYQYGHSASVRCIDSQTGGQSGYLVAQTIASGLLRSTPPFGYIDAVHSGFYNTSGQRLYSETTDIFNGSTSFEERFIIQARDFVRHSVDFNNGVCNITESATIKHSGISKAEDVFVSNPGAITTRFDNALAGAYTRCNSLYSTYATVLGTDAYPTGLAIKPVQVNRAFDERTQEFNYSVVYTNNPNMAGTYTIEREQTFSQNSYGISQISEQGVLIAYAFKDPSLQAALIAAINAELSTADERLADIWPSITSFQQDSESKSVSVRGKRASYNISYTNDPSFLNDGTFLIKSLALQDNEAIRMHNPYFIIGRNSPLVHNPGQTQFGSTSCTIYASLPRPVAYYPATPQKPTEALNQMFLAALNAVISSISVKAPLDMFVSRVTYTYNSDMTAEASVEAQYVYPRTTNI